MTAQAAPGTLIESTGYSLFIVDAFTRVPFRGNPAGVVILAGDGDGEDDAAWMQSVATELRYSETAFARHRGDGSWDLRWFTPAVEVDLCGHATLATAHVLGGSTTFHTRSGELHCSVTADGWISMDFPADPPRPIPAPDALLRALGGTTVVQTAEGVSDLLVEVDTADAVVQAQPDLAAIAGMPYRGVIITAYDAARDRVVSRCFYPAVGVPEDPVTGSAHCTIGSWWCAKLGRDTVHAEQLSDRGGELRLTVRGDRISLTGLALTIAEGKLLA
jgi:predicted PhzF superfamily epimerase YddE/YHI9